MANKVLTEGKTFKEIMTDKSFSKEWILVGGAKRLVRGIITGEGKVYFPDDFVASESKLDTKSLGAMKISKPKFSDGTIWFLKANQDITATAAKLAW